MSIINSIRNLLGQAGEKILSIGGLINYQENDPTTPELITSIPIPPLPSPCPPIAVLGFTGNANNPIETQAAQVYLTKIMSLTFVQKCLARPLAHWSFLGQLISTPRAGQMFNAYYDRYGLNFFYDMDPFTKQWVYTADSADVVSHELGHAILDALRPDIWAVQAAEIHAFHEAFGDMNAILTSLTHPEIIKFMLQETSGDLKHDNVVSRLAEQVGAAVYHVMGGVGNRKDIALRDAINNFHYVVPETLPVNTPPDQLSGEAHNFSRVFTGGFYDMFVAIYNDHLKTMPPEDAIGQARDLCGKILYNSVLYAQISPRFYESVVRSMLLIDRNNGYGCSDFIAKAFNDRGITLPLGGPASIRPTNFSTKARVYQHNLGTTVHVGSTKHVRINDLLKGLEDNHLYKLLIEVPDDHYLEYDHNFCLMKDIPSNLEDVISSARYILDLIKHNDKVGEPSHHIHKKEFSIADDKLVRNYFSCGCCCKMVK